MSDPVAEYALRKIAEGVWISEIEDAITALEAELEATDDPHARPELEYKLTCTRGQLEKRKAYAKTLPRLPDIDAA